MPLKRLQRLRELVEFATERKLYFAEFQVSDIRLLFKLLDDNRAVNGADKLLQIKRDGVVYKFDPGEKIDLDAMGIKRSFEK